MGKTVFTVEQLEYIRAKYKVLHCKEIAEHLGLREWQVRYIINERLRVKLRAKSRYSRTWTPTEIEILRDPNKTDYQKAKALPHRTDSAVRIQRKRLGFDSKPITFHRQFKSGGYWFIRRNNGYVKRSKIVAEEQLGRELSRAEVVHHINGDKSDDSPQNLYVCKRTSHTLIHYQAMEVIKQLMEKGIVSFERERGKYILC